MILRSAVKERCGLHPGRIPGWGVFTIGVRWEAGDVERWNWFIIGMKVENRSAGRIHRCTTGIMVVSGLPGDVERNRSRFMDFTVGEAKTSFARQVYRGNWGLKIPAATMLGNQDERCGGVYL